MDDTAYNPRENLAGEHGYAATEDSQYHGGVVVGEVHDENAAFLGGVAGHAGLFSTVDDLSTFARALLNGGAVDGTRILAEESVERMTKNQLPDLGGGRGLGWERRHVFGYVGDGFFDAGTYGQNGFTGTSLWVAPNREVAVVTLTNRVHPSRENTRILDFRGSFHNFLARLLTS
jgi:CubicO group peptidase (beta-lactamase class C family)